MALSPAPFLLALLFASSTYATTRLCVPKDQMSMCQKMVEDAKSHSVDMTCVSGSDRVDCLEQIKGLELIIKMSPTADIMFADPEDMYVGAQMANQSYNVFKQIRTKIEPEADFRYESVAVIPKSLKLENLASIKGLPSCHTGFGRNAGYKIPYTVLSKMGIMKTENNPTLSTTENELHTWKNFFSKSCIVGKWSSHPEINRQLKVKYSNLCELCEEPQKCDYPDKMSGYDGALRCITEGEGKIAFTKVIAVKKFFGLPYGNVAASKSDKDHTQFEYLCTDGTRRPLDGPACPWAARPWQGFIGRKDFISENYEKVKSDLDKLSALGDSTNADWKKYVLGMDATKVLADMKPVLPLQYLKKARYLYVIERVSGNPMQSIKICERNSLSLSPTGKCERLAMAAYSRGIRPKIECIHEPSDHLCLESVQSKKADLAFADPAEAYNSASELKPLMTEKYPQDGKVQYLAFIVPKDSAIKELKDIKGKRMCFWSPNSQTLEPEKILTIKALIDAGIFNAKDCPYTKQLKHFAYEETGTQSCLTNPLVTDGQGNPIYSDILIKPLVPGLGRDFEAYHPEDKFELLCKGTPARRPLSEIEQCNFGEIPPNMLLVKKSMTDLLRDEIVSTMTKIGDVFNEDPEYLRLFGDMQKSADRLVSNAAVGFEAVKDVVPSFERFKEIIENVNKCSLTPSS